MTVAQIIVSILTDNEKENEKKLILVQTWIFSCFLLLSKMKEDLRGGEQEICQKVDLVTLALNSLQLL